MPWFTYSEDVFEPVRIKASTINEAINAGMQIAKDMLGSVDKYCMYEGNNEVVIEYWRDKNAAVKLIYADNPARALMHYYNAERAGLVMCTSVNNKGKTRRI
jgi:hypothetical protein